MSWEEQKGSEFWMPKESGESLEGKVIQIFQGNYGNLYIIEKDDGNRIVTPSHKLLQSRLQKVKEGDVVKVVYEGEEPPTQKGHSPTKIYKVYVEK